MVCAGTTVDEAGIVEHVGACDRLPRQRVVDIRRFGCGQIHGHGFLAQIALNDIAAAPLLGKRLSVCRVAGQGLDFDAFGPVFGHQFGAVRAGDMRVKSSTWMPASMAALVMALSLEFRPGGVSVLIRPILLPGVGVADAAVKCFSTR